MSYLLLFAGFTLTYLCARRSLGLGFAVAMWIGSVWGIVRANLFGAPIYFLFDGALAAVYLAVFSRRPSPETRRRAGPVSAWATMLIGWPCVLFLIPQQHPLVQMVGLRAAAFFLPCLLLGARATLEDLEILAKAAALLILFAFGVALAEYFLGVTRFFPRNASTNVIYGSRDIGNYAYYRIPSTFQHAHAYAGTMVHLLPFVLTKWIGTAKTRVRLLYMAATVAAVLGVFLAGPRLPTILMFGLGGLVLLSRRLTAGQRILFALAALLVAWIVGGNERLQRFTALGDPAAIQRRIKGSVNERFLEIAAQYPLGAGLARGAGTSVPSFLMKYAKPAIGLENEYSRILVEQGLIGVGLYVGFILWTFARRPRAPSPEWELGYNLIRGLNAATWGTTFIGAGLLLSVPLTPIFLFQIGMISALPERRRAPVPFPEFSPIPAPTPPGGGEQHAAIGRPGLAPSPA